MSQIWGQERESGGVLRNFYVSRQKLYDVAVDLSGTIVSIKVVSFCQTQRCVLQLQIRTTQFSPCSRGTIPFPNAHELEVELRPDVVSSPHLSQA
jgi:hypothetical protein